MCPSHSEFQWPRRQVQGKHVSQTCLCIEVRCGDATYVVATTNSTFGDAPVVSTAVGDVRRNGFNSVQVIVGACAEDERHGAVGSWSPTPSQLVARMHDAFPVIYHVSVSVSPATALYAVFVKAFGPVD